MFVRNTCLFLFLLCSLFYPDNEASSVQTNSFVVTSTNNSLLIKWKLENWDNTTDLSYTLECTSDANDPSALVSSGTKLISNSTIEDSCTGLKAATIYQVNVTFSCSTDNCTVPDPLQAITKPVPVVLSESATTENSLTVSWSQLQDPKCSLNLSLIEDGQSVLVTTANETDRYTFNKLSGNTKYTVTGRVICKFNNPNNSLSSESESTISIRTTPMFRFVHILHGYSGRRLLEESDPSPLNENNVNFTISARNITVSIVNFTQTFDYILIECSSCEKTINISNIEIDSAPFTGLEPFTNYTFNFTVFYQDKESTQFTVVKQTLEDVPSAPQNVTVKVTGSKSLMVTWKEPENPNGIVSYKVSANPNGHDPVEVNNIKGTSTKVTGLQVGTNYSVIVTASTSAGSTPANAVVVWTKDESPSDIDSTVVVQVSDQEQLNVTWNKPDQPGGVILQYWLLIKQKVSQSCEKIILLSCSDCENINSAASVNSVLSQFCNDKQITKQTINFNKEQSKFKQNIDYMRSGALYQVLVLAVNRAGSSNILDNVKSIISAQRKSSDVTSLSSTVLSPFSIGVSWKPPNVTNGLIIKYLLRMTKSGYSNCIVSYVWNCTDCKSDEYVRITSDTQTTVNELTNNCLNETISFNKNQSEFTWNVTGLAAYTEYTVEVYPINSLIPQFPSNKSEKTLPTNPESISQLQSNSSTSDNVTITWTRPLMNGEFSHYVLKIEGNGKNSTENITDENKIFTDLTPCSDYTVTIIAVNTAEFKSEATNFLVNTLSRAPNVPNNLILTNVSSTELKATWNSVSLPNCPIRYGIELTEVSESIRNETVNTTNKIFVGLKKYTEYSVKVRAIAGSDQYSVSEGEFTLSVKQNTSQDKPGVIPSLRCDTENAIAVNCYWYPPNVTNGIIIAYRITVFYEDRSIPNNTNTLHTPDSKQLKYTIGNIKPEKEFRVFVSASTEVGYGPEFKSDSMNLDPSIPKENPLISAAVITSPSNKPKDPKTQVKIQLPHSASLDTTYGAIQLVTLVIVETKLGEPIQLSEKEEQKNESIDPVSGTYKNSDVGRDKPYELILSRRKQRRRRKRSTESVHTYWFTVGDGSEDCAVNSWECNGPLRPGVKYKIGFRVYSKGGYRTYKVVEIETDPDMTGAIVGAVFAVLIIVALAGVLFVLFRMGKLPLPYNKKPPPGFTAEPPNPVPYSEFVQFTRELSKDGDRLYAAHFELLGTLARKYARENKFTTDDSLKEENRGKNRYSNILPYDQTRVKLSASEDMHGNDYINANFMPGHMGNRVYIASQGPLPATLDDHWRMIWEKDIPIIVMLTQLVERGRTKCAQYWPDNGSECYGDITVEKISETKQDSYISRCFTVSKNDEKRNITQMHMLRWPDHDCPSEKDMKDLLDGYKLLIQTVCPETRRPTLVHCSAGVGRTGCFICLDTLTSKMEQGCPTIDIFGFVQDMRRNRMNMIQTEPQYIFLYRYMAYFLKNNGYIIQDDHNSDDGFVDEPLYANLSVFQNHAFTHDYKV